MKLGMDKALDLNKIWQSLRARNSQIRSQMNKEYFKNCLKHVHILQKQLKTCSYIFKTTWHFFTYVRIRLKTFPKIFKNSLKHFQIFLNIARQSRHFKTFENISRHFKIFLDTPRHFWEIPRYFYDILAMSRKLRDSS